MNLVRTRGNNNLGLRGLHDQLDDIFENLFTDSGLSTSSQTVPSVDIYSEDDKSMVLEMPAPGYDEKDIDISLQKGVLEIRAQRRDRDEEKDKKRGYMLRESTSSFYRRIMLPEYADGENVRAELDKGVLKLTIPFAERPEPKRIQVKSRKTQGKLATKNK